MAYTGKCMLTGDKFQIFHKYVEDIMGRSIMTHEIGLLANEIKEKSKADFIALCADESSLENSNRWIPCGERLPGESITVIGITEFDDIYKVELYDDCGEKKWYADGDFDIPIVAWMPLPPPYKAESENKGMYIACKKCKYNHNGECDFYYMGSGNEIDMPCYREKELIKKAADNFLQAFVGAESEEA